jgi:two-component system OmpR family response regulator
VTLGAAGDLRVACRTSPDIMRVLLVEDNVRLAELVRQVLAGAGMDAELAAGGRQALDLAGDGRYDAIILDLSLPDIDGLEVCRTLRGAGVTTPILMLTARDALRDRVFGLEQGADDYVTKPFALRELVARLRALGRRGPVTRPDVLEVGELRLDRTSHRVARGDEVIELPAKLFLLLARLMEDPGAVVTRTQLLDAAWDTAFEQRSNVVDAQIRRLRERIDEPFGTDTIETVRGVGYRLRVP